MNAPMTVDASEITRLSHQVQTLLELVDGSPFWSLERIAQNFEVHPNTARRIVAQPGFPASMSLTGADTGSRRWLREEVVEWFRLNRGRA